MSTEDDIARVHAVTEKLVGPQTVWVLLNEDEDGLHVNVYISEAVARESWKNFLQYLDDRDHWRKIVDGGATSFEPRDQDYWSLHEQVIQAVPFDV